MRRVNHFTTFLNTLVDAPSSQDPDNARRRRLLNIILGGLIIASVLTLLASGVRMLSLASSNATSDSGVQQIFYSGFALLIGLIVFYSLNRSQKIPAWVTSGVFLIFMMVLLAFTDNFEELANGRSLFVFSLPVIMASMLLQPAFSFVFAFFSAVEIGILANLSNVPLNVSAIAGYFFLALVSWLSARNLETALKDLRHINTNLDELVERKTEELANALSRELVLAGRNQAILNSIADGVIVFDAKNVAILANPALSRITETPLEELIGARFADVINTDRISPTNRGTMMGLIEWPEKTVPGFRIEWGKKTLSTSIARVQDSAGENIGTVAVFRDISREAELERMKETFVAIVSHELRTPLNAIMGHAEILKEAVYGPLNEKQASITERIMVNVHRLLGMVGDLLDEAQIRAGKLSIKLQVFKTESLLETLHNTMDKIAADKGLSLTTELDPALPENILGDPQRLQQILINLVNNAVKFTENGGIHVRFCLGEADRWRMEVSDTGIGIPEDEIPYIFDTFRQVDSLTTRQHGGFGLGLSIVKQLVGLLGGRINVKSENGKGSTFTVILPLTTIHRP